MWFIQLPFSRLYSLKISPCVNLLCYLKTTIYTAVVMALVIMRGEGERLCIVCCCVCCVTAGQFSFLFIFFISFCNLLC